MKFIQFPSGIVFFPTTYGHKAVHAYNKEGRREEPIAFGSVKADWFGTLTFLDSFEAVICIKGWQDKTKERDFFPLKFEYFLTLNGEEHCVVFYVIPFERNVRFMMCGKKADKIGHVNIRSILDNIFRQGVGLPMLA